MSSQSFKSTLVSFRLVLCLFIFFLILSGVTAFPLVKELELLTSMFGLDSTSTSPDGIGYWILTVRDGLKDTYAKYPWMAYGTDWLAFAHIVIAIFFIGPFIDPVKNVWVLWAGLIACALIIPLALICGSIRHIPFGWQMIDCSFGILGAIPLCYCLSLTKKLSENGELALPK